MATDEIPTGVRPVYSNGAAFGTPEYWLARLNNALDDRFWLLGLYSDYYEGRHRSMFQSKKYREEFGYLARGVMINFCCLVVDAERERLTVDGFRFGNDALNDQAWRLWQRSRMDARSDIAITDALRYGVSYLMVGPGKGGRAKISVESPLDTIVAHDPEDPDTRLAALKRVLDDDGYELAWLYLPDAIYKFRSRQSRTAGTARQDQYWDKRTVPGEAWPLPNPLKVVPVVPLLNNPTSKAQGRSELQNVIPIQDLLNKEAADLLIASEFVAYPQRYAIGIEAPVNPTTGEAVEPFKAGVNRLWMTEGENVTFGQFPAGSLQPYVQVIEMHTQQIATISKTPPHYLLGSTGTFPSGESLKATETGLVSKSRQAQRFLGEPIEEAVAMALRLEGAALPDDALSETVWHDPENRIQGELTDAVLKESTLGVPFEFLMEKLGYSQIQIQRMKVARMQETLRTGAALTVLGGAAAGTPAGGAFNAGVNGGNGTGNGAGPGVPAPVRTPPPAGGLPTGG